LNHAHGQEEAADGASFRGSVLEARCAEKTCFIVFTPSLHLIYTGDRGCRLEGGGPRPVKTCFAPSLHLIYT
jgi:hypothetical protein